MESLLGILWVIMIFICSLAIWYLYHKLFTVYYFDWSRGCFMECLGCFLGGGFLATIILNFWYIAIIVIAIIVFVFKKKKK